MSKTVCINEINSPTIRKNIARCEEDILKFTEIIRSYIRIFGAQNVYGVKELFQAQKQDPVLRKESMYRRICPMYFEKYIANVLIPVCEYEVVWIFDLTGAKIKDMNDLLPEHTICFRFSQCEFYATKNSTLYKKHDEYKIEVEKDPSFFLTDGETHYVAEAEHTLSIEITGLINPYDTSGNHCQTIAESCGECETESILNAKVATMAITKINSILDELILYNKVEKEFKDC